MQRANPIVSPKIPFINISLFSQACLSTGSYTKGRLPLQSQSSDSKPGEGAGQEL